MQLLGGDEVADVESAKITAYKSAKVELEQYAKDFNQSRLPEKQVAVVPVSSPNSGQRFKVSIGARI